MNKSDLVARLAERLGGDRALATAAVNGVLEEIQGSVAGGERVSLTGFGTFDRRERAARTGRNPRTGATIQLAASVAPVFRAGAGFRSLLTPNGHSPAAGPSPAGPTAVVESAEKKRSTTSPAKAAAADTGKASKKAAKKDRVKSAKKASAKSPAPKGKKSAKKGR